MPVGLLPSIAVAVIFGLIAISMGLMAIDSAVTGPATIADLPMALLGVILTVGTPVYGIYLIVSAFL